jgi:hypothetical protein
MINTQPDAIIQVSYLSLGHKEIQLKIDNAGVKLN